MFENIIEQIDLLQSHPTHSVFSRSPGSAPEGRTGSYCLQMAHTQVFTFIRSCTPLVELDDDFPSFAVLCPDEFLFCPCCCWRNDECRPRLLRRPPRPEEGEEVREGRITWSWGCCSEAGTGEAVPLADAELGTAAK